MGRSGKALSCCAGSSVGKIIICKNHQRGKWHSIFKNTAFWWRLIISWVMQLFTLWDVMFPLFSRFFSLVFLFFTQTIAPVFAPAIIWVEQAQLYMSGKGLSTDRDCEVSPLAEEHRLAPGSSSCPPVCDWQIAVWEAGLAGARPSRRHHPRYEPFH